MVMVAGLSAGEGLSAGTGDDRGIDVPDGYVDVLWANLPDLRG